jgi:uncharacterized protein YecT (DUF1311 family)
MPLLVSAVAVAAFSAPGAGAQSKGGLDSKSRYARSDAALNGTYQQLLTVSPAGGKGALRAAERSWIKFRDDQCAFEVAQSAPSNAHLAEGLRYDCLEGITDERNIQLQNKLKCPGVEGDVSCGK